MWNLTDFFVYLHHMLSLLLGWICDFSISIIRWVFFAFELVSFFSFLSCYFIDCIFRCVVSGLSQNVSVQWKFSRVCRLLESVDRYPFILLFFILFLYNFFKLISVKDLYLDIVLPIHEGWGFSNSNRF